MGTITINTPSDGETIDAADVATPLNTIANEFNGGIDNDNIASGAGIDLSKLANSTNWQDWTPDISAFGTLGNGSVDGRYIQIGKTVIGWAHFQLGSTSAVSAGFSFDYPVTPSTDTYGNHTQIGTCRGVDDSAGVTYLGWAFANTATRIRPLFGDHSTGSYVRSAAASSTVPFTWATDDTVKIEFIYEAA